RRRPAGPRPGRSGYGATDLRPVHPRPARHQRHRRHSQRGRIADSYRSALVETHRHGPPHQSDLPRRKTLPPHGHPQPPRGNYQKEAIRAGTADPRQTLHADRAAGGEPVGVHAHRTDPLPQCGPATSAPPPTAAPPATATTPAGAESDTAPRPAATSTGSTP